MLNRIVGKIRAIKRSFSPVMAMSDTPPLLNDQAAFLMLNEVAPLASRGLSQTANGEDINQDFSEAASSPSIVCREAVLGRDQRVASYAFTLRHRINERLKISSIPVRRTYDEVLLRNLQSMEFQRLLGHRLAFISISTSSLDLPIIDQLTSSGTVYVVETNHQPNEDATHLLERLAYLKSRGYRVGMHGKLMEQEGTSSLLAQADHVLIDIGNNDIPTIQSQLEHARKQNSAMNFVATQIQTREDFDVCSRMPFSLYQGAFITHREDWEARPMDPGRARILMLLNKLRSDGELNELVSLIRQDPALSFKLLRYINSPGMGLVHKVGALDQALMILGRQKLYRWLTLLIFTSGESRGLDRALMENALVRARLSELLSENVLDATERDELFVAGVFSLLDVLLGSPMKSVLEQVSLPLSVNEVLLERKGKYAPFLNLAIACEQHEEEAIAALAESIGLNAREVNRLHIEALVWAQEMGQ